jgi:hypothetical protein
MTGPDHVQLHLRLEVHEVDAAFAAAARIKIVMTDIATFGTLHRCLLPIRGRVAMRKLKVTMFAS